MNDQYCISLRGLKKSFLSGQIRLEVLKGIDLDIPWGSYAVITGTSGSGKSTLLHIIGGLDRIDSGQVTCCGESIGNLPEGQLSHFRRKHPGFIFQNHYLIDDLTVTENLVLPGMMNGFNRRDMEKSAAELIERVGLTERRDHHPQQLSGGERQRVAVARAFVNNPSMILADEPTGNLDEENTRIVMDMLTGIISEQRKTLVMVTHDQELSQTGERLYLLKEGVLHQLCT